MTVRHRIRNLYHLAFQHTKVHKRKKEGSTLHSVATFLRLVPKCSAYVAEIHAQDGGSENSAGPQCHRRGANINSRNPSDSVLDR